MSRTVSVRHLRRATVGVVLLALAVATPGGAVRAAGTEHDWTTFGFDLQRSGFNPYESKISTSNVDDLEKAWAADLGGAVVAQPVEATNVSVDGKSTDLVYVGSEKGTFFALNAATGKVVWKRFLGSHTADCGDVPDGHYGITGAATIDRAAKTVYVTGGNGRVYALALATGDVRSGWPVRVVNPDQLHAYGGLTLDAPNGRLYATFASYCDHTPYHGQVALIDVAGHEVAARFFPAGKDEDGGGVWGPGGVSIDPATHHVFTATGNAMGDDESLKDAEHVVELSWDLKVLGSHYPGLTGFDVDFGATPLLYRRAGCPPHLAVKNKSGVLLVYRRGHVGDGPVQRLQVADVNDWEFNGIPAVWPDKNLMFVSNSSATKTYTHGMVAFRIASTCKLKLAWQKTEPPDTSSVSPPTVANGVVYYANGYGNNVIAYNAATGERLWDSGSTMTVGTYGAPMVVNGQVFVPSFDGHLYAFGLP